MDINIYNKGLPSHLKSGHDPVPVELISVARTANMDDVAKGIEDNLIPLIHQDKHERLFLAVKEILREDTSVAGATIVGVTPGFEKDSILNQNSFYEAMTLITDAESDQIVVINDLRFKRSKKVDWNVVESYLKEYIGVCTEIFDTNEMIYIGSDFPDEYSHSKDTKVLRGPNEYAKANASAAIKELIKIASNKVFSENYKDKHNNKAKYGWYRYDTRFAIPKYDNDGELAGYNVFKGRLVIRHAKDGKLYLYDVLRIKKETSEPLE